MDTVRDFRRAVEDLQDSITAQHGRRTPYCEILHRDLGLPENVREDAEEVRARAAEAGHPLEEGSIKLTIEHEELHEALRRFVVDSMSQGQDAAQFGAQMLLIGRKMGFQEASKWLGD